MQYCFACSILLTQSAKLIFQYSADASSVKNCCPPKVFVAVNVILFWISSPGAAGYSKIKGLDAFGVEAIVCFRSSISS